jgi:hypothetical protein
MNDTSRAENAPEFPGFQAMARLGAGLLVALFLILVLVWRDNGQRAKLETTAEFTSVGDTHYFPMPAAPAAPPYPQVAALRGEPLYLDDPRKHEFHADDLTRVGRDEKTGCLIYKAPVRKQDVGEHEVGAVYFLKLSPTEYLKVRGTR